MRITFREAARILKFTLATVVVLWLLVPVQVSAQVAVGDIRVEGTQRIEPDTVRSYMTVRPGDPADAARVDQSLKSLFATGLFSDVTIRRDGRTLIVSVVENPIINRRVFEGNKHLKDDKLAEELQLGPRVIYTRTKVRSDVQRILELYRRSGRFAATVEPKVIQLPQNRVDLVYEISEGEKTGIRRINFIGNQRFGDGKLRRTIATRESRWWRFLTSNDTFDPDRMTFDRELLRQHYLTLGYADFRVISAVAELTPDREDFFITFTVEEGDVYDFGEISVNSEIKDLSGDLLVNFVSTREGERYSAPLIERSIETLTEIAGLRGYAFVDIRPRIRRDRENRLLNITYQIDQAPRTYVEKINITGNFRTLDRVIRREFRLLEGDAFNSAKLRRSRVRIRALGFFNNAEVEQVPGSSPDRTVINVTVQERPTGELALSAGVSSREGVIGEVSIRERNLLGKGQDLRLAVSVSSLTQSITLGFTEPRFLDRELAAGFDLFFTRTDLSSISVFESTTKGGQIRTFFPLGEFLSMGTRYVLTFENIDAGGFGQSVFIREGDFTTSSLGYTLSYDTRNDAIRPSRGFRASFSQDLAGVGGNVRFLRNNVIYDHYYPFLWDNWVLNFSLEGGYIVGLGQDVEINNRFFVGSSQIRGFEPLGIGPRDLVTLDALGGNIFYTGGVEVSVPIGPLEELGLLVSGFVDFGSLWNVDDVSPQILDVNTMRVSAGIGVSWDSPFGPLRLDFAEAIRKGRFDETEFFQFNVRNRF